MALISIGIKTRILQEPLIMLQRAKSFYSKEFEGEGKSQREHECKCAIYGKNQDGNGNVSFGSNKNKTCLE